MEPSSFPLREPRFSITSGKSIKSIRHKHYLNLHIGSSHPPHAMYMHHACAQVGFFSLAPLRSLAKMPLSDLRPGFLHMGRYLLVRTKARPYKLRAVFTVVEDEQGQLRRLSLYGFVPKLQVYRWCREGWQLLGVGQPWLSHACATGYLPACYLSFAPPSGGVSLACSWAELPEFSPSATH